MSQETAVETRTVCYVHPDRETYLRCNRCDRPICTQCAVLTPTGYRCKECVRGQQKVFDTARWIDYPLAFFLAAGISFLGSIAAGFLGFFTIFLAPVFGLVVAEVVRWAVGRRRSRLLFRIAAAGTLIGALPRVLIVLAGVLLAGEGAGLGSLIGLLWPGLYAFLITSSAYYRLSGISIR
jgi:hypothetical protein